MTKHIFGLALFSLIVGASAVVYALFNVPEIVPVSEVTVVSVPQYSARSKYSCKMKRETKSNYIEIKQVVLDLETEQLNFELATPNVDEPIDLLFFSKDEKGTRFITAEQVNNSFSYNGRLRFSSSYNWLNKRKSTENLYMLAQFASDSENYSENYQVYGNKFQPKFDAQKAVAITVDHGK